LRLPAPRPHAPQAPSRAYAAARIPPLAFCGSPHGRLSRAFLRAVQARTAAAARTTPTEPDRHAVAHAVLLDRYGDGKAATMAAAEKLFHPLAFAKAEGTGLWVSSSAASILDLNVSRQHCRLPASFPRWFAETLSSGSC